MPSEPNEDVIRTPRLELVPLTTRFAEALVAADLAAAGDEIGARVGRWLATDPRHVIQLDLAKRAARSEGFGGFGRVIVRSVPGRGRLVVGSIGFHGPPDDRGRLELGCRIGPPYRGRGYAAEAMAALTEWATTRFGITRFLVAVPSDRAASAVVPLEVVGCSTVSADVLPGEQ